MRAAEVGDALVRRTGFRTEAIVLGLTLAFTFPEWARALYEGSKEDMGEKDESVLLGYLREFVEAHPIEREAGA